MHCLNAKALTIEFISFGAPDLWSGVGDCRRVYWGKLFVRDSLTLISGVLRKLSLAIFRWKPGSGQNTGNP